MRQLKKKKGGDKPNEKKRLGVANTSVRDRIRITGIDIQGSATRIPFFARVVKFIRNLGILSLMFLVLVWFLVWAGVVVAVLHHMNCFLSANSMTNSFLLVFTRLLGGSGPSLDESGICPVVSLASSLISFMTHVGVVGLVVNKMAHPKSEAALSQEACVRIRDGSIMMQFRNVSLYGHCFVDMHARAFLYHSTQTAEGESMVKITELAIECANFGGIFPININHMITEDSPLFGIDLVEFTGSIYLSVKAFDTSLQCSVNSDRWYSGEQIKVGCCFCPCFVRSFEEASRSNTRPIIDFDKFNRIQYLTQNEISVIHSMLADNREVLRNRQSEKLRMLSHLESTLVMEEPEGGWNDNNSLVSTILTDQSPSNKRGIFSSIFRRHR